MALPPAHSWRPAESPGPSERPLILSRFGGHFTLRRENGQEILTRSARTWDRAREARTINEGEEHDARHRNARCPAG